MHRSGIVAAIGRLAVATAMAGLPISLGAQEAGVLLGQRLTDPESGSRYRTLWITRDGGGVRVAASGPDLIVPRRSGFWRVCLVSGRGPTEYGMSEWDSLVAAPATARRGDCAAPADTAATPDEGDSSCRSTEEVEILFLGTDAVSLETHEESDCGAHPSGGTTVTLMTLEGDSAIDITRRLSPAQRSTLIRATLRAANREFADLGRADTADSESEGADADEGLHFRVQKEWGVERGAGRWQLAGNAYCSPYVGCGDGPRRFSIPGLAPPPSVTGPDVLVPPLAAIRAGYPRVTDAVASPRGDLLVAVGGDSLLVFAPRAGKLGTPVLLVAGAGRIVMAQWAIGRFVPIWTERLTALLGRQAE